MFDFPLDDVKIIHCKECGIPVNVNVKYPIDQVTCKKCWFKKELNKKWKD